MKKILLSLCLFLFSSAVLAQGEVNVYTARHYDSDAALYAQFTAETGIEVNVIEAKASELIERIKAEGDSSPADLLITVDAGRLWRADQAGLFQPVASHYLLENVPANLRHHNNHWYGLTRRARAIFYNRATVNPDQLSTYADLASDKWEGSICIRSSSNIYNQSLLASIIAHEGRESATAWAQGMVDNMARRPQGGDTDQLRAVAAGECDIAVANSYYYGRLSTSDDAADREVVEKVGIFFPNQETTGTHVNISGAGVLSTAPNAVNALRLLEFLLQPSSQEVFAAANHEYPVLVDVAVSDTLAEWGNFQADDLETSLFGENNPAAVRIFDEVGWR